MEILQKAQILSESGKYDSCGPKSCEVTINPGLGGIYHAKAENKTCRLFKTVMENDCSLDCSYCGNSSHCKKTKASYEPEELANLFIYLHNKLDVEGLFLSSALSKDPDQTTEKMLSTVKLLRLKKQFRGYIHFKILPGTSYELVKQASELSTRMSINLEAPNSSVLNELSNCKAFKTDILKRQAWISKLHKNQTTQLILNDLASDKAILKMVDWEYSNLNLKRIYYSAFKPVKNTPLENKPAEPLSRQNHLYNVDFLLREYNFKTKEIYQIMDNNMLPHEDPKLALAKLTFDSPLDINEASYEELIRIPGIGPKTAKKLEKTKIKKYEDLHKLGGWVKRAKPFIKVNGHIQTMLTDF